MTLLTRVGIHEYGPTFGFTLIEIAITLVIVALLLGGFIGPMSIRIEQQERQKTQVRMDETKEALYGFAAGNGRLPCPDTNGDGREDPTIVAVPSATICAADVGDIPWVDLAVSQKDAWDRSFVYRVTSSFADGKPDTPGPTATCTTTAAQASFVLCSIADISVFDCDPDVPISGCPVPSVGIVAEFVPAVVISHGAHRFRRADASAHEQENFESGSSGDTPGTVVARGYTGATGQEYDDLVVWVSANILKNRMIIAGKLP